MATVESTPIEPSVPVSVKSTAVTALISKKQLDSPALSLPVTPLPSLSNPTSAQSSPLLSTFPAHSNSRRSSIISHSFSKDSSPRLESEDLMEELDSSIPAVSLNSKSASDDEDAGFLTTAKTDKSYISSAKTALGRAFAAVGGHKPVLTREPTVTLPTLGRENSVFQAVLTAPSINTPQSLANVNSAASTVELDTIVAAGTRPPAFAAVTANEAPGMDQLVDRYGFLHEKNGMKVYRELRQRQMDKSLQGQLDQAKLEEEKTIDNKATTIKRLLAQLADMNETQEKSQRLAWDDFLKRRRTKLTQPISEAAQGRRDRHSSNAAQTERTDAVALLGPNQTASGEEELWSDNLIGIARMGISGKSGKEAWREFKQLVRSGIPIAYRPSVWSELSGATEIREPGYYNELLSSRQDAESLSSKQISSFLHFRCLAPLMRGRRCRCWTYFRHQRVLWS